MIIMTVSRTTGLVLFCTPATWSNGIGKSIVSGKREAGCIPHVLRMNKTLGGLNQDQWVSQWRHQSPAQGCWEGALSTADGKQLSGDGKWHSSGFLCSLESLKRVCSLHSGGHMVPPFPKGKEGWSSTGIKISLCKTSQGTSRVGQPSQNDSSGTSFFLVYFGLHLSTVLNSWHHHHWCLRSLSAWINASTHPDPVVPVCHSHSLPSEQTLMCVLWQVCRVVCPCVFSTHKWYCPGELVQFLPGFLFHSALCVTTPCRCVFLSIACTYSLTPFTSNKYLGCHWSSVTTNNARWIPSVWGYPWAAGCIKVSEDIRS